MMSRCLLCVTKGYRKRIPGRKGKKELIHQYKNNGFNIVLDVNSGAVHVVDDVVYDVIASMVENHMEQDTCDAAYDKLAASKMPYDQAQIKEALEEIYELKDAQMLFTDDIYEKSIEAFKNRETVVKALCLHIAHDCNLACKYCFAEEGEYHGRRALMSFEVGKKALDFLVANSGNSGVAGEAGDGFGEDHVDLALPALPDHAKKILALAGGSACDAFIRENIRHRPVGVCHDFFRVVCFLVFVAVELLVLFRGHAAVCGYPEIFLLFLILRRFLLCGNHDDLRFRAGLRHVSSHSSKT